MHENDKETSGSQPKEEMQPPSETPVAHHDDQPIALYTDVGMQPPSETPIPLPLTPKQKRKQYLLGLVFGLIPLIVFLVGLGIALGSPGYNALGPFIYFSLLALLLYVVELIITIVYLANKKVRFVGYGLLTAFLATPIVVAIRCSVHS